MSQSAGFYFPKFTWGLRVRILQLVTEPDLKDFAELLSSPSVPSSDELPNLFSPLDENLDADIQALNLAVNTGNV